MSKRLRLAKSQSKTQIDPQYFDDGSKELSKTKRRSLCIMDKKLWYRTSGWKIYFIFKLKLKKIQWCRVKYYNIIIRQFYF